MEIAVRPKMHTYAGGLGILAGDTARSCADLKIPVVLVTLVSRRLFPATARCRCGDKGGVH
jgi:glycogen phosphorylase